ncbi:MAG: hypothetical protein JJ971_08085 [Balneolaceae bacterium]|nr:hypothetical protein [Balneolaceae bacterium]MBO6546804.1 hypothetical protein [Balneolaceae bacterium]MBO6649164.1 hypothetical protein [Balneolaceae bacterium]
MGTQVHILNGDALKAQFPEDISGEQIVLRECFVDGPVREESLNELYKVRAVFLGISNDEYTHKVVSEFKKIEQIPNNAEINLWFEDDLFCQVNFWFTVHLLQEFKKTNSVFLVRPEVHTRYGFAAYDKAGLEKLYKSRHLLEELDSFQKLWIAYQKDYVKKLVEVSEQLYPKYPFLQEAVKAQLDRRPTETSEGRPKRVLREIMGEFDTTNFGPVFREFCQRESIYGFGDLQVKRLFDEILGDE